MEDTNGSSKGDNLYALLTVPSGAVSRVQITMTVYGNYLSDLIVAFQPGGLVFAEEATLEVIEQHHGNGPGRCRRGLILRGRRSPR